jgi:hypothetical protein
MERFNLKKLSEVEGKEALTSPTGGGRSVSIVRLRTKSQEERVRSSIVLKSQIGSQHWTT